MKSKYTKRIDALERAYTLYGNCALFRHGTITTSAHLGIQNTIHKLPDREKMLWAEKFDKLGLKVV
jgi:hypothetical protein